VLVLFPDSSPAFFLLAKKSGRDESWLVYFWRETLPLATSLTFSPEGKTLMPGYQQDLGSGLNACFAQPKKSVGEISNLSMPSWQKKLC
jgi:hypothetical protein